MLKAIGKLFKMIISVILILIFLALALIGYAHFIEPNRLTVTHIEDTSGSMKESLTVALFADTHFGSLTVKNKKSAWKRCKRFIFLSNF